MRIRMKICYLNIRWKIIRQVLGKKSTLASYLMLGTFNYNSIAHIALSYATSCMECYFIYSSLSKVVLNPTTLTCWGWLDLAHWYVLMSSKRHIIPWIKFVTLSASTRSLGRSSIVEMVQQASADRMQAALLQENPDNASFSLHQSSASIIHRIDQILRRCVALRMSEAKGNNPSCSSVLIITGHSQTLMKSLVIVY